MPSPGDLYSVFAIASFAQMPMILAASFKSRTSIPLQRPTESGKPASAAAPLQPGPEMRKLGFLIGDWGASDKYEKTDLIPNGGEGSGTYKTVIGPGSLSLLTDYHYKGPHGESNGHQVLTWDPKEKQYAGYIFASSFPGCIVVSGNWEGSSLVLSGEYEVRGMKVNFEEIYSDISEQSIILKQFNSVKGEPPRLFGTTRLSRK
jgi:uncharacterized protein DUF1579